MKGVLIDLGSIATVTAVAVGISLMQHLPPEPTVALSIIGFLIALLWVMDPINPPR